MSSHLFDCPVCGTWECAACGWRRSRANRFAEDPQDCHRCGSRLGEMKPIQHTRYGTAENHVAEYDRLIGEGRTPRYPLAQDTAPRHADRDWLVEILAALNGLPLRPDLPHRRQSIEQIYGREIDAIIAAGWESEESIHLRDRMADLLTRTANALKGEPVDEHGDRFLHDWSDLPEVAEEAMTTVADLDGTDDAADWIHAGHCLAPYEVVWIRSLRLPGE